MDRIRDSMQLKHYAYRTEETYLQWVKQYILFQGSVTQRHGAT
ncbi:phage integrase N-terminal SAM-like domain-containing protein [Oscillatoria sp. CS-180]